MDKNFFKKLDRLLLSTDRLVKGGSGGIRRSSGKGSSIEFSDYREYTSGDDFRHIDWNAYARFDRLFIKLFMEEQETMVTVFLDTSKSMDFGEPNKGDIAKDLTAVFSYIALSGLDRLTVATLKEQDVERSSIYAGKQSFFRAYDYIYDIDFEGETYISRAIKKAHFLNPKAGISIIISDLFSKDDYREGIDYLLYRGQDVVVIHILSPQEREPNLDGSVQLIDSEDGSKLSIMANNSLLRSYSENVDKFLNGNREFCHSRGIHYVDVNSNMDLEEIVFGLLMRQKVIR